MNRSTRAVVRPSIPEEDSEQSDSPDKSSVVEITRAVTSRLPRSSMLLGKGLDGIEGIESLKREVSRYDFSLALDLVVERIAALKNVSGAAIAFDCGSGMSCVASTGSAPAIGATIHSSAGLSGECIQTRKSIVCADTSNDERVDPSVCERLGLRSVAIVPILRDTEMIGLVELFSASPNGLTQWHRIILESVAEIVSAKEPSENGPLPKIEAGVKQSGDTAERERESAPIVSESSSSRSFAENLPQVCESANWQPLQQASTDLHFVPPTSASRTIVEDKRTAFEIAPFRPVFDLPGLDRPLKLQRSGPPLQYVAMGLLGIAIVAAFLWLLRPAASRQTSPSRELAKVNLPSTQPSAPVAIVYSGTVLVSTKKLNADVSRGPSGFKARPAETLSEPLVPNKNSEGIKPANETGTEPSPLASIGPNTPDLPDLLFVPKGTSVTHKVTERSGGKLLTKVQPIYPESARLAHLSGNVRIMATIDEFGKVSNVRGMSGPAQLLKAAEEAVRQWQYEPLLVDGKPTGTQAQVQINFKPAR